jgi:hypothetical protein
MARGYDRPLYVLPFRGPQALCYRLLLEIDRHKSEITWQWNPHFTCASAFPLLRCGMIDLIHMEEVGQISAPQSAEAQRFII